MTRAEFAKAWTEYWMRSGCMKVGETLIDVGKRNGAICQIIADVATNGFDAEPGVQQIGWYELTSLQAAKILEQTQEAAKRSRPFVGSHRLPFDSDWD